MTTYYVGAGGNNGNAGTSWALRKLTLNGAEDIPVAAGDTVYVGPGVYRETLTVDVSGAAGQPITYIGDYTGANTDGVGGVVRITGSDNDKTATRANCVTDNGAQRNYRTFNGFALEGNFGAQLSATAAGTNWIIENCYFANSGINKASIAAAGATQSQWTIRRCVFNSVACGAYAVAFTHTATVDNATHVVENCIMIGGHGGIGISTTRVGGIICRNCTAVGWEYAFRIITALSAGQTFTVNNCIISGCMYPLFAAAADGTFVENYNCIFNTNFPRINVAVGANSVAYIPQFDTRWFFELVGGGKLVTPFDLGAWSQLINVAGTAPPAADMRGTTVQGAQREWGPLEYDTTLLDSCPVAPAGGTRGRLIIPRR